jgi:hypothetical protein
LRCVEGDQLYLVKIPRVDLDGFAQQSLSRADMSAISAVTCNQAEAPTSFWTRRSSSHTSTSAHSGAPAQAGEDFGSVAVAGCPPQTHEQN